MVDESEADEGVVVQGWDVEAFEETGGADSGELEELGGGDYSGGEDDFFVSGDSVAGAFEEYVNM